jgi:hypothetical protein
MPTKLLSVPPAGLLLAVLTLFASDARSLRAEDVYVTGWAGTAMNYCPPSCPYNLGTSTRSTSVSIACPVPRDRTVFGAATNAAWAVTPTLTNYPGLYRIFVTKGTATSCPTDLVVLVTATGGDLADVTGTAQTNFTTTAFQGTNSVNSWTLVGYLTNRIAQPSVTFTYASGGVSRFYMDAVDFQSVETTTGAATPASITEIHYGNPLTISGTGPVSHLFALVSSTNAARTLNQWAREQTNSAGTGSFTFSVAPGTAKAQFFRVISE